MPFFIGSDAGEIPIPGPPMRLRIRLCFFDRFLGVEFRRCFGSFLGAIFGLIFCIMMLRSVIKHRD